jgi:predicted transcriptional regulator
MTAVSPQMMEELIGLRMAALARSEGHTPSLPKNDRQSVEKQRETRARKMVAMPLRDRYQRAVYQAIKRGIRNVRQISELTDIEEDAVRRACRDLHERGKIRKAGIIRKAGGNAQIWEIVSP